MDPVEHAYRERDFVAGPFGQPVTSAALSAPDEAYAQAFTEPKPKPQSTPGYFFFTRAVVEPVWELGRFTRDVGNVLLELAGSDKRFEDFGPIEQLDVLHNKQIDTAAEQAAVIGGSLAGYMVPFLTGLKAVRLMTGRAAATKLGQLAEGMAAGALADFTYDPALINLANTARHFGFEGALIDYLAAGERDEEDALQVLKDRATTALVVGPAAGVVGELAIKGGAKALGEAYALGAKFAKKMREVDLAALEQEGLDQLKRVLDPEAGKVSVAPEAEAFASAVGAVSKIVAARILKYSKPKEQQLDKLREGLIAQGLPEQAVDEGISLGQTAAMEFNAPAHVELERAARQRAKRVRVTPEVKAMIEELPPEHRDAAVEAYKSTMASYPSRVFHPVRAKAFHVTKKGKVNVELEVAKPIVLAFDKATSEQLADKAVSTYEKLQARAAAGDDTARKILAQAQWYSRITRILYETFGPDAPMLADVLGAFSPNNTVRGNMKDALDLLRAMRDGAIDDEMEKFAQFVREGGNPAKYPGQRIRKLSGVLYGQNTNNGMLALLDMWQVVRKGTPPKARTFSATLEGSNPNVAVIDKWMLRYYHSEMGGKPIPPPVEPSVAGAFTEEGAKRFPKNSGVGDIDSVYGKLNDATIMAAERLGLRPDELQAVLWHAEKERWAMNGWTSFKGMDDFTTVLLAEAPTRTVAGASSQTAERIPTIEQVAKDAEPLRKAVQGDDTVMSMTIKPTEGVYKGDVERSVYFQLVGEVGFDPRKQLQRLARFGREHGQESVLLMKVLPDGFKSQNMRPGIEVVFTRDALDSDRQAVFEKIAEVLGGATQTVAARGERRGILGAWTPEFDDSLSKASMTKLRKAADDTARKLQQLAEELKDAPGVKLVQTPWVDTVVLSRANYERAEAGAWDTVPGFGRPITHNIAATWK